MPYRKRPRRARKPKTWRKAAGTALSAITSAGVNALKRKLGLNTEKKLFDTIVAATNCPTSLTPISYPYIIPQGDTTFNRQGATVRVTSYHLRLKLTNPVTETNPHSVRVIVASLSNTRGDTFIGSNVLEDSTTYLSAYENTTTGIDILYDRVIELSTVPGGSSITSVKFDWYPANHHLKWNDGDTTGATANLQTGSFATFLMYDTAAAVLPPVYHAFQRVKFVDN